MNPIEAREIHIFIKAGDIQINSLFRNVLYHIKWINLKAFHHEKNEDKKTEAKKGQFFTSAI